MSDEQREIIETIRDRRDRAVDAHGRTAAAMDVMHLSPFEQAVYVDESLNTIDRLTAERDVAYAELSRVRYAIDRLTAERDAARRDLNAIFELTITDVMASYDPEQIVHHVSILRNERDAARAEVERLRAACAGISEGLIRTATHGVENLTKRDWLIQTAQNITAALKSEVSK